MKKYIIAALLVCSVGCAVKVNPGGPVTVNPISVNVNFNMSQLAQYFTALCEKQLSPSSYATADEYNAAVVECTNADIGSFLIAFPGLESATPTPTPTP
jgi:hypothetical protein